MRRAHTLVVIALAVLADAVHATDTSIPFIHADQVHAQGITGAGVTVAVVDSGIDRSDPGLQGGIAAGGASCQLRELTIDGGSDIYGIGHGTYMSLIITDPSGVAPDAKILPIRVATPAGVDIWDAVLGIQYVITRRLADPTIRVINLSFGIGSYSCHYDSDDPGTQLYAAAISQATISGIITFAATGNDAQCGGIHKPACVSAAIPVAADYDGSYFTTYFDPPGCGECIRRPIG
jgi:subtilisin family serine protease